MSFAPFLDQAHPALEGVFSFQAEATHLREATASVRLAAGTAKDVVSAVRCVLKGSSLKLSAYSRGVFAEEIMPVTEGATLPSVTDVAFVLDLTTLGQVVSAFPRGSVAIHYDAARRLLTVSAGRARIELPVLPPAQHTDYSGKLGFPQFVAAVPTELLRQGLRYASLFSPSGPEAIAHLAACDLTYTVRLQGGQSGEVRQGLVAGGSERSIFAFQSPSLRGLNLSLHQSTKDFVIKALGRLDPANTRLFQTQTFSVFLDGQRMFGLEKPVRSFPSSIVEKHVRVRPTDLVQVLREDLKTALGRVRAVSDKVDIVQLAVAGSGEEATLAVRMADPSGRLAEDTLQVRRAQEPGIMFGRPREALLSFPLLSGLLKHFPGEKVTVGFDGPLVRLFDTVADASATSVLVCETPPLLVNPDAELAKVDA